jgi:hypothetical protein
MGAAHGGVEVAESVRQFFVGISQSVRHGGRSFFVRDCDMAMSQNVGYT